MRTRIAVLAAVLTPLLTVGSVLATTAPASAHGDRDRIEQQSLRAPGTDSVLQSPSMAHLSTNPSQAGISGCFMKSAPVFVTSGVDSVRVWDVRNAAKPRVVGVLANALFENEAMNCGERRTKSGTRRFALIGVDLAQASPGDISHANVGGGELVVVDVTNPAKPRILSRAPGSTSTHTVACVDANCTYAYTAGSADSFTVFDLRKLGHPVEVDSDRRTPGVQAFASPTGGHKWALDAAGIATHTGWNGASMWDVTHPRKPRLLTTTGRAGKGTDPRYPGWNDFIEHNSLRPNALAFKPGRSPSLKHGNILLTTEEDYEQTDCAKAGSFQTWWVKRLNGKPGKIVPLDKVELADLGNFPLPRGAFCSSHWFDYREGGLVAAGFYGGGTQILDVRDPRHIKAYGHAIWGASEVWDAMWVPVYRHGAQTGARSNVVYSIDLVRGLDVYAVDVPGDGVGAVANSSATPSSTQGERMSSNGVPAGVVGTASLPALVVGRRRSSNPRGSWAPGVAGAPVG